VDTRVAGILLAAGEGSRLGRPKALVEFGGRTLAERGVAMLKAAGADPIVLVTGAARVSVAGARTVRNLDWRTGMGSSLAAGLSALETVEREAADRGVLRQEPIDWAVVDRKARRLTARPAAAPPELIAAAVIALADQPLVGSAAVARLIAAFAAGSPVAVAAYGGKPRNPVLIGREHWDAAVDMAVGDIGARPFLRARPELVTLVECADTGSPFDIDTPQDLKRLASERE
jgi:CTP:molybdopterin cytidylyltransferase MocA